MSFSSPLSPSPVCEAFHGIQWDPLEKLRLTGPEKATLRSAEANPLDYTLADRNEAAAYARVLLKVLAEASGPSGPSSRVSHLTDMLPVEEALQLLYVDAMGVVTHYAITKLYEIVLCFKENGEKSRVSIASTFYGPDGSLVDDWRPLLRVLHLGGSGDVFAQRGAAYILGSILLAGTVNSNEATVIEPLQALVSWIASQLQSSASSSLTLVTPTLTILMSCPEARTMFQNSGGIGYLSRHLRPKPQRPNSATKDRKNGRASVQQLYELCFCLWTLTYECNSSALVRTHTLTATALFPPWWT